MAAIEPKLKSVWLLLGLIVLISISECIGQSCLKMFYKNPKNITYYAVAVAFYSIVCALLVLSYQYKGMGIVNVLWSGISVLTILGVGMAFFNETITTMDMFGIFFIILGIILILWEGTH